MALTGSMGVEVTLPNVPNPAAILFGEDQGRALVTTTDPEAVIAAATASNIFAAAIGRTGGDAVTGPGFRADLAALRAAHEGFFPRLMGSELTPEL
jgi:phosphoribosylformylglycinamidine synthase